MRALTVRTEYYGSVRDKTTSADHPSGILARGLFKHHLPIGHHPSLELHDINFQNQNLCNTDDTWLRFVNFTTLKTLQVWNCDNVDDFIECLKKIASSHPLRLHGVVLSFELSKQSPKLAQDFVGSLSNLQYLNLCYSPEMSEEAFFDVHCLEKSKKSIKDLYVGVGANANANAPLYALQRSDIEWLCSNCLSLRQLAVALPPIRFDDAFAGRWGEIGEALVSPFFT